MRRPNAGWLAAAVAVAVSLAPGGAALADNPSKHPLQRVADSELDLVVSLDWNPNTVAGRGKPYLDAAFAEFGGTVFAATEGHLRICKLYVYSKRRYSGSADIVVSDSASRANAQLNGIDVNGQILLFTRTTAGVERSGASLGRTMGHELGHYALGLKDEYTEQIETEKRGWTQTRPCDVRLTTLMGSEEQRRYSTPETYRARSYAPWVAAPDKTVKSDTKRQHYARCEDLVEDPDGDREDATWRTAQYRSYEKSAWEVLISDPRTTPLPAALSGAGRRHRFAALAALTSVPEITEPAWNRDCFQVIYMEGTVLVLMIDHSVSMGDEIKPGETKFQRAAAGAKTMIDTVPVGDSVALISFAETGDTLVGVTKIEDKGGDKGKASRDALKAQVDSIVPLDPKLHPVSQTNVTNGLVKAWAELAKRAEVGNQQFVVLLSDGSVRADDWALAPFTSARVPVYTIGVKVVDGTQMQRIATATRGKFFRTGGSSGIRMGGLYQLIVEELSHQNELGRKFVDYSGGDSAPEVGALLNELDGEARFSASWPDGVAVAFELRGPGGEVITANALPPGIRYVSDATYGMYVLDKPAPGQWKAVLTPAPGIVKTQLSLDATSSSPLALHVHVSGGQSYPEPFTIVARVSAPSPVVGAQVEAILDPDGPTPRSIVLVDDGQAPDEVAADGRYTAVVADLTSDGSHDLKVVVSNPSGSAAVDTNGGLHAGDGQLVTPLSLSNFAREAKATLVVAGAKPMPQSYDQAIKLRNDMTPLWGSIDKPGDVVYFAFNGYAGGHYAMMTGSLASSDGKPMRTKLTLYAPDGTTVRDSDAGDDGTSWLELRAGQQDQVYFLKVEHAGAGTGRFQIAVAPRAWFGPGPRGSSQAGGDDGGGGSGSGCRVVTTEAPGSTLPVVLLVLFCVLAVLRRRARRRARGRF
ncbi:MAG: VWA domain-containing protein [Myxococcales bacterium]|nr:VWA domain-containing protein [Myxococcales bacterium]